MSGADARHQAGAGDLAAGGVVQRVGIAAAQVALVDDVRVGAVGAHPPEHLDGRPELHHIFPPGEEDGAVGKEARVPFPLLGASELAHVGAIGVHRVQAVGQRPVATLHQAPGAFGHEGDAAVGQVDGVGVLVGAIGELAGPCRAIQGHLPHLELVAVARLMGGEEVGAAPVEPADVAVGVERLAVLTLGRVAEDDPPTVKRDVGTAEGTLPEMSFRDALRAGQAIGPQLLEDADATAGLGERAEPPRALMHHVGVVAADEEQPVALEQRVLERQPPHGPTGAAVDPQPRLGGESVRGEEGVASFGDGGEGLRAGVEIRRVQKLQVGQDSAATRQLLVDARNDLRADLRGGVLPVHERRSATQAVLPCPVHLHRAIGRPEHLLGGQRSRVRGPQADVAHDGVCARDVDELEVKPLAIGAGGLRDIEKEALGHGVREVHGAMHHVAVGLEALHPTRAGLGRIHDVDFVARGRLRAQEAEETVLVVEDDGAVVVGLRHLVGGKQVVLAPRHVRHGAFLAAVVFGHEMIARWRRELGATRRSGH